MNGEPRHHIRLKLGILAHNLLIEEYPLAEQHITPLPNGGWLFEANVASYVGIARFVVGLLDDIEIVDTPELEQYLSNYITRHWSTDQTR